MLTFNVNIDNAVCLEYYAGTFQLNKGTNEIEVPAYTSVNLKANTNYAIAGKPEVVDSYSEWWWSDWSQSYQLYVNYEDVTTNVTAIDLNAARTEEFTINIEGDVDYVSAALTGSFTTNLDFFNMSGGNENQRQFKVKYAPEYENILRVTKTAGAVKNVYAVQCGKYSEERQEVYDVPLTPGCVVNIEQAYPDVQCVVTIKGNTEAISSYRINEAQDETPFPANGKIVTGLDDQLQLTLKSTEYMISAITVNGEVNTEVRSSFNFIVDQENTEVVVDAHPFQEFNVLVYINDPAGVKFGVGYEDYPLVAGENVVAVSERSPSITISPAGGFTIESVKTFINGVWADAEASWGYYNLKAQSRMEIHIEVAEKDYPCQAIVWVNDVDAAPASYSKPSVYANNYADNIYLVTGYQSIGIAETPSLSAPQQLYLSLNDYNANVYTDGRKIEGSYGSYYADIVADNQVVKVYYAEEPVECQVSLDIDPAADIYVVQDWAIIPTNPEVTCFNGSLFMIAGNDIDVFCNDKKIEATEAANQAPGKHRKPLNGVPDFVDPGMAVYNIVVEDPETNITVKIASGVESVAVDNIEDNRIYNLQGVQVGAGNLDTLPAGLYIRGGKKIVNK